MNTQELSKRIETVTANLKTVKAQLQEGKTPSPLTIQFVKENIHFLTFAQKKVFLNIIVPKVEQMNSIDHAIAVRKNNPFLKLPFIKNMMHRRQDKNRTEMIEERHIKEGIPTDPIETMTPEEKQKYLKKEIVVISDLHGAIDKWQYIKQELSDNPLKNFVILGDAMDRGDYGLEILLEIKELSDKGIIQYLPGNHDIFAYNYLMCKGKNNATDVAIYNNAKKSLELNNGNVTIEKLENFDRIVQKELADKNISNPITLQELTDWLGKQPIQTIINENQTNYALAHAIFDTPLYKTDKDFNLEKALNSQRRAQR